MFSKYHLTLFVFALFTLSVSCSSNSSLNKSDNTEPKKSNENPKVEGSRIAPGLENTNKITGEKPRKEKEPASFSGSAKAGFGTFNFKWNVDPKGTTKLATLESSGSGELPPKEKKIFLQIRNDGTTRLYHEWYPLVNVKKPVTLKYIVDVPTAELFSLLPEVKIPAGIVESTSDQKIQPIAWGKTFKQNNIQYLPCNAVSAWKLNIFWEKKTNQFPELIAVENYKQQNMTSKSRLYLLIDENNNTTILFMEKQFQSTQGNIPYLLPVATVKTDELISGFNSMF
jgi:hypothetical protein